jgi:hypothetical protein
MLIVPPQALAVPACCHTAAILAAPTILSDVGFNPFHRHQRSPADLVMLAAAVAVVLGLLVWALLG